MTGQLVLVSTPIGNLGDLSARAIDTLRAAALICCEDTRRTGRLLQHAGVRDVRLAVANEHTEAARVDEVLALVGAGHVVALVTDAGTPGISDPGERLVRAVVDAGLTVSAVPGPAALVMALVLSGFDTTRFVFEGFLPRTGADRARRLDEVSAERRTIVLYEAPHRVERTLADLAGRCGGERRIALARELTKLHEHVWRGSLNDARQHVSTAGPRGEFVVVIEGASSAIPPAADDVLRAALVDAIAGGATRKDAIATVTADFSVSKRRVFDIALTLPR